MPVAALEKVSSRQSFIQATEVWIPDAAHERLVRAEGVYGPHTGFEAASAAQSFAKGEGLPGRVWAEGRPILLHGLRNAGFLRAEAAAQAGLSAAIAIPVFSKAALKGVLVMLCGEDEARVGAVEIWRGEEAPGAPAGGGPRARMKLDGGFYGAARLFREVSEKTEFERGQGLPGGVWAAGAPMLMRDLGGAYGFVRSVSASAAGLATGLGVPIPTPTREAYVLALLSARATPIARRFEIWDVTPGKGGRASVALLTDGLCEVEGPLWGTERKLQPWQGAVGRAMASGAPIVEAGAAGARHAGMVAFPIHHHAEVAHVVAWYF